MYERRRRNYLLQVCEAHGAVIDIVVNVASLEERLTDQPVATKSVSSVDRGSAVVAVLLKSLSSGKNVEVGATKVDTNSGRRAAVVVTSDNTAVELNDLDAGLLEETADSFGRAKEDGGTGVGDDALAGGKSLAVDGDVARSSPLAVGRDANKGTRELVSGDGAVVQSTGVVGLQSKAKATSGQRVLVAQTVEKWVGAESSTISAAIANEAIVRERRLRLGASNVTNSLLLHGEVGAVLCDDVVVNVPRCLIAMLVAFQEQGGENLTHAQFTRAIRVGGGIGDVERSARVGRSRAGFVDTRVQDGIRRSSVNEDLEVGASSNGEVREPKALLIKERSVAVSVDATLGKSNIVSSLSIHLGEAQRMGRVCSSGVGRRQERQSNLD